LQESRQGWTREATGLEVGSSYFFRDGTLLKNPGRADALATLADVEVGVSVFLSWRTRLQKNPGRVRAEATPGQQES
jgi:hypothetical protein